MIIPCLFLSCCENFSEIGHVKQASVDEKYSLYLSCTDMHGFSTSFTTSEKTLIEKSSPNQPVISDGITGNRPFGSVFAMNEFSTLITPSFKKDSQVLSVDVNASCGLQSMEKEERPAWSFKLPYEKKYSEIKLPTKSGYTIIAKYIKI